MITALLKYKEPFNGWGERCGNTNLSVLIPNIHFKVNDQVFSKEQIQHITYTSRYFSAVANVPHNDKQAYTGKSAFAHKAGQHADVILKNPELMEHIDGVEVGNKRRILLSELAGKATILYKIQKFGKFSKASNEVAKITSILKEKEQIGYEFESAEASFELLVRKVVKQYSAIFSINKYNASIYYSKKSKEPPLTQATISLQHKEEELVGMGESSGPVGALDKAIRKATFKKLGFIENIKLMNYKVRVLNSQEATEARVLVSITSRWGQEKWTTIGVSSNIIEASLEALIDSFDYIYNRNIYKKK